MMSYLNQELLEFIPRAKSNTRLSQNFRNFREYEKLRMWP